MTYDPYRHLYNVGLALTQLLNALTGGDPDESFSGRSGREREAGSRFWTVVAGLIDLLWWPIERDHCSKSIERDRGAAAAFLRKSD